MTFRVLKVGSWKHAWFKALQAIDEGMEEVGLGEYVGFADFVVERTCCEKAMPVSEALRWHYSKNAPSRQVTLARQAVNALARAFRNQQTLSLELAKRAGPEAKIEATKARAQKGQVDEPSPRFRINWYPAEVIYKVTIPDYEGGEVVHAEAYDELKRELSRTEGALREALVIKGENTELLERLDGLLEQAEAMAVVLKAPERLGKWGDAIDEIDAARGTLVAYGYCEPDERS